MNDDSQPVTQRVPMPPMPSLVGGPVVLPDVRRRASETAPRERPTRQPRTGARTREAGRPAPRPTRSDAASQLPRRLAGNWAAQDAVMLGMSQPHSLAQIWAHHRASAEWYEAGLFRWPRFAYGVLAVVLAAAIYAAVWWLSSLSRALATAGAIALAWWWPF